MVSVQNNDFVPFEISGLSQNEYLPNENNKILYNQFHFRCDKDGVSFYNTEKDVDVLIFFDKNCHLDLVALCDNQLFLRNSDENKLFRIQLIADNCLPDNEEITFVCDDFCYYDSFEKNRILFRNADDELMCVDINSGVVSNV